MLISPGPIIFDFGSFQLRWYGLIMLLAFFSAFFLTYNSMKKELNKETEKYIFDWALMTFIGGIIGARLWFVILKIDYFTDFPLESFAIWNGGQSIQGGFVGGIIASWIFYKLNQKNLPSWAWSADYLMPGLALAQAIGRWGNFFNIEAFGKPTNAFWGLFVPETLRPLKYIGYKTFHPTFLYESIFLLFLAVILYFYGQKLKNKFKLKNASILMIYLIVYSLGRFFLEFYRLDSLIIFSFPAAQIICLLTIIICSMIFVFINKEKLLYCMKKK